MKQLLSTIIILLTLCQLSYALEANFLTSAKITGESVVLGDIVRFSEENSLTSKLKEQEICPTPPLGQQRSINAQMVLRLLSERGMLPKEIRWQGAKSIHLEKASIEINREKILTMLTRYLAREGKKKGIRFHFTPASLPAPFQVRSGKLEWQIVPSHKAIIGSSRFAIILRIDDRVQKNFSLPGKLKAYATVAIAQKEFTRNQPLDLKEISMVESEISTIDDPIYSLTGLQEKKCKRRIQKGAIIRLSQLQQIPLIHRGDRVKIHLNLHGLQLTTLGIARADGGLNDYIRVQNISSNKIVYSQVIAPGIVEVSIQ